MDDMIPLKIFALVALIFGVAGLLAANPVFLAIAGLSVSNLIGTFLMGGEDFSRRRTPRRRTDISPYDCRS